MSDPGYFDEPEGVYVDAETGEQYDEETAAYLVESGEYQVVEPPYTPDTPGEYGVRDRDLWPRDPEQRKAAREAAFRTMYEERRNS